MNKKSKKNAFVVLMIIVVAMGLLGFNSFSRLTATNTSTSGAADNIPPGAFTPPSVNMFGQIAAATNPNTSVPCIDSALPVPDQYHIHPHLTVIINGQNITIPANVGLTNPPCEREIHTHDNSGTIHIEPNTYYPFTLGDFFNVWGEPFSFSTIFNYTTDATHKLTVTVDGRPSDEFQSLVLKDQQQIVINYETGQQNSATSTQ